MHGFNFLWFSVVDYFSSKYMNVVVLFTPRIFESKYFAAKSEMLIQLKFLNYIFSVLLFLSLL